MAGEETGRPSVLIPTGFDPASYACVRSLSKQGVNTIIASEYRDVPAGGSRFCDEQIVIPSPFEDLLVYKDALLELAARPDVQTITPIRPHDAYVFSKYSSEFEQFVTLPTPPFETLRTVHDRVRLIEAAEAAGVPAPETWLFDDVVDWDDELIIKSRYNLLADEYLDSYAPNESDTVKAVKHLERGERPDRDAILAEMKHVPIVQEYVPTADEYVFGALYNHGEPLATFQHRQIRGNSYTGSGGVFRESVALPELESVGRTLLDHLDWHGFACIEYMEDAKTGEFKLTEINPRMWQSLPSAVTAGADFPLYYWLQVTGQQELIEPEYEIGVGSHLLHGELEHVMSVLTEDSPLKQRPSLSATAWEILTSCYKMPHFDYLRLDDPRPFIRGLRHVARL